MGMIQGACRSFQIEDRREVGMIVIKVIMVGDGRESNITHMSATDSIINCLASYFLYTHAGFTPLVTCPD